MSLTSCFLTNQWASVHSTLSIPCPMKWRVFVTALWRHLRGRLPSNSKLDEVLSNISRKPAAFIVDLLHCETPLLYVVPICIYSIHVRWVKFHESTCRSLKHVLFLELFIFSCQFNVKLRENLSRRYHSVIGCTQSTGARYRLRMFTTLKRALASFDWISCFTGYNCESAIQLPILYLQFIANILGFNVNKLYLISLIIFQQGYPPNRMELQVSAGIFMLACVHGMRACFVSSFNIKLKTGC